MINSLIQYTIAVLQLVKFYTVVKVTFELTFRTAVLRRSEWVNLLRQRTTVRNLCFIKYYFHKGVKLSICKTVSVETPTQHSIYDNIHLIWMYRALHVVFFLGTQFFLLYQTTAIKFFILFFFTGIENFCLYGEVCKFIYTWCWHQLKNRRQPNRMPQYNGVRWKFLRSSRWTQIHSMS